MLKFRILIKSARLRVGAVYIPVTIVAIIEEVVVRKLDLKIRKTAQSAADFTKESILGLKKSVTDFMKESVLWLEEDFVTLGGKVTKLRLSIILFLLGPKKI